MIGMRKGGVPHSLGLKTHPNLELLEDHLVYFTTVFFATELR